MTYSSAGPTRGPDGTLYLVSSAGLLHAVDRQGKPKWTFPVGRHSHPVPPVVGPRGLLYVPSPLGHLLVLTQAGTLRWHMTLPKGRSQLAVRWDGAVVVLTAGDSLRMIGPPRGK